MLKKEYLDRMKDLLDNEFDSYCNSINNDSVRGIHVNKNKINVDDFLKINDIPIKKMNLEDDLFYLDTQNKIGRHPFHHAGMFYIQDPSAMIPAYSIDINENWNVLDLCSAPGGKTAQIAPKLKNGVLFSNEIMNNRARILFSNVERLGFRNTVILNNDSEELAKHFQGYFDMILVDAPCSGEGMFRKEIDAVNMWSQELVLQNSERQKKILLNADRMLKEKGYLVYSTCTFSREENEDNVSFLMDRGYVTCEIPEEIKSLTKEGLIENTRRFYPHLNPGEGQFVAVLRKTAEEVDRTIAAKYKNENLKVINEFIDNYIIDDVIKPHCFKDRFYHVPTGIDLRGLNVISYGVFLGTEIKNRFVPEHNFFTAFGKYFKIKLDLPYGDDRINKYLRGEEINADVENGFGVILINGVPLGGFKAVNGILKNYYPKGLRNF